MELMLKYFLLAAGGALGAILRYIALGLVQPGSATFPWGTLFVNSLGSFVIGLLWFFFEQSTMSPNLRIFLFIGLLGGFTTFSAFSLETMNLIRDSERLLALLNVLLAMIVPLVFAFAGLFTGKYILSLFK